MKINLYETWIAVTSSPTTYDCLLTFSSLPNPNQYTLSPTATTPSPPIVSFATILIFNPSTCAIRVTLSGCYPSN